MDTDRFYEEVGRRIAARRKRAGFTQDAFASMLGMSRPRLASIERGRQRLPLHVALAIAQALKLDGLPSLLPSTGATEAMIDDEIKVFGSDDMSPKQLNQIGAIYRAVGS